jgi:uncharacterized small protein (TIGR04563 family)
MGASCRKKQSVYLSDGLLRELVREASRQGRSISWMLARAWKLGRRSVMSIPPRAPLPRGAAAERL